MTRISTGDRLVFPYNREETAVPQECKLGANMEFGGILIYRYFAQKEVVWKVTTWPE